MQKYPVSKGALLLVFFVLTATLLFLSQTSNTFKASSQEPFTPTPQPPASPQTIESDTIFVHQQGLWEIQQTSSASGGSYLYGDDNVGDILTLVFQGTSVTIIYVEGPTLGTFAIEIDTTVVRTVITTNANTSYGIESTVSNLDLGEHLLRVYPVQGTIAIDAFFTITSVPGMIITPAPTPEGGAHADASFVPDGTPTSGCPGDQPTYEAMAASGRYFEVISLARLVEVINNINNAPSNVDPYIICIRSTGQTFRPSSPIVIRRKVSIFSGGETPVTFSGGNVNHILYSDNYYNGGGGFTPHYSETDPLSGLSSLFIVASTAQVEISHIHFQNGNSQHGGAIFNNGVLRIYDSVFSGNRALYMGGAITNFGLLDITRTVFENNSIIDPEPMLAGGGGIFNGVGGQVTAFCLDMHGNTAPEAGGAIANDRFGSNNRVYIHYSTFSNNDEDIHGGFSYIVTVDATNNYWVDGPTVTPDSVDVTNPWGYNPVSSESYYPPCIPKMRPIALQQVSCEITLTEAVSLYSLPHLESDLISFPEELEEGHEYKIVFLGRYRIINEALENDFWYRIRAVDIDQQTQTLVREVEGWLSPEIVELLKANYPAASCINENDHYEVDSSGNRACSLHYQTTDDLQVGFHRAPITGNPVELKIGGDDQSLLRFNSFAVDPLTGILWFKAIDGDYQEPVTWFQVSTNTSDTVSFNIYENSVTIPSRTGYLAAKLSDEEILYIANCLAETEIVDATSEYPLPSLGAVPWGENSLPSFGTLPVDLESICLGTPFSNLQIHGFAYHTGNVNYGDSPGLHMGVDFFIPFGANVYSIDGQGIVVGVAVATTTLEDGGYKTKYEEFSAKNWGAAELLVEGVGYAVIVRYGHSFVLYGHLGTIDPSIYVGKMVGEGELLGSVDILT